MTEHPGQSPTRTDERLVLLADHAQDLGRRPGAGPAGDRWLAIAGGAGIALGLVAIVLGWYGSAQTTLPFEQTPFLISGGLLGIALVVGGGLLYVCAWLTRLVHDNQTAHARAAAHQDRLEQALAELAERVSGDTGKAALVVTASGSMLHRDTCASTVGQAVHPARPDELGLPLCGLCRPVRPSRPRTTSATATGDARPSATRAATAPTTPATPKTPAAGRPRTRKVPAA